MYYDVIGAFLISLLSGVSLLKALDFYGKNL